VQRRRSRHPALAFALASALAFALACVAGCGTACDRVDRINAALLAQMVRAVGYATGQLAAGAVDLSR
jgi:hypothetical protein